MAYKLAKKEGRDDVTAVPYGISVPHYFLVTFAIMLPLKIGGADFETLWSVGVAWCFVHAIVATIGAFVGPTMQKLTPRAAMLGTLAGVAITYIAMGAAFNAWNVAWLSMISFGIIFVGWLANIQFPGRIPAGLVAVILGIIFGWASGYMHCQCVHCNSNSTDPNLASGFTSSRTVSGVCNSACDLSISGIPQQC
jgi:AGZA family xanthine/uracil permease-like MFS transporter